MPEYDINLREYWRILKSRRKFLVIFTAAALGVFSVAFAILRAPSPVYTSVCSIKFERETTVDGLFARTITWSGGDDIGTQISLIKGFSVFEGVAERLGLVPKGGLSSDSRQRPQVSRTIDELRAKVEVTRENSTNILNIQVKDTDPAFAQRLANTIALAYRDWHSENQMKRTTEAIKYIEDQLVSVRQKLREAEEAFNRFSQQNQLLSVDLQSEKLLARTQEVKNELQKLDETKDEFQTLMSALGRFTMNQNVSEQNFFSTKVNAQYQAANDALVGLLLKKESMLQEYTPQHPEVIDLGHKIIEHARKMKMLLDMQVKEVEKKELHFQGELQELERKAAGLMEKKLEFDRLKRKVELYHDMTTLLEQKNQEAMIRKAEKPEEVTVVKPAVLPTEPINPPRMTATGVTGILIGLVIGLLAAFVVETFDTSLGAIEDVEKTLKTNVLGVVPHGDSKSIEESLKEKVPKERIYAGHIQMVDLVAHFSPNSMIAESFRGLRTNLQSKDKEGKSRTIAITSASPQEGKTLVSINLAIAMAQTGLTTLLVGSDMRKPTLGKAFGVENIPGLSDILLGNYPWRETVKTISDIIVGKMTLEEVMITPGLDNLHFITSGTMPPNPAELIQSRLLKDFVEEAKKQYDIIIFDSPPILSTADAAILGSRVDGVLLVYRIGSVSRGLLKRSITQLEQANCNILGAVLNDMKPELSPDFQDYKQYRYYYSYGEEGKRDGWSKIGSTLFGGKEWKDRDGAFEPALGESSSGRVTPKPKSHVMRYFLLMVGAALLGGGMLWQSGFIGPQEWFSTGKPETKEITKPGVRGIVPKAEPKSLVTPPPESVPVKRVEEGEQTTQAKMGAKGYEPVPQPMRETPIAAKASETKPIMSSTKTLAESKGSVSQPRPGGQPLSRKEATAEPKEHSLKSPSFPYSVYMGSSATLDQAKGAISNYSRKGLSPYWSKVDLGQKGTWFRIYLGHFKSPEDAERFVKEHGLKEAEVKKTEYANLIGVYARNDELDKESRKLSGLGHMPYVIRENDGKSRLIVGAFVTEAGADGLQRELRTCGVDSQIVRR